jgi:hypothetical protein
MFYGVIQEENNILKHGCLIISCFAGIGKNYAIEYYRKYYRVNSIEKTRSFNKANFVNEIKTLSKVSDILFIPYWLGMKEYVEGKINFLLVYPDISLKQVYFDRFRKLGFTEEEMKNFEDNWDDMIADCETYKRKVKITKPDEYLYDVLDAILN